MLQFKKSMLKWGVVLCVALLLGAMTVWAAEAPKKTLALTGTFNWNKEKPVAQHPLTATLTPTGDEQWSVVWNFTWNKKPTKYTGTITGELENGKCSGTGTDGKRTFVFEGTAKSGAVTFNSSETTPKRSGSTGTGTFSVK